MENESVIVCPPTGRLGNQLLNIILASTNCFGYNISFIKLPNKLLFYDKDLIHIHHSKDDIIINECDSSANYTLLKKIYMKNFWDTDFYSMNLEVHKDKIKKLMSRLNFPKVMNFDNNILHIHIRSGDIMFPHNYGYNNIQPPCIYYEDEIKRKNWSKVVIVSEDDINPCIKFLTEKYDNVVYFGKNSLEEDIIELLSATNIMMGRGTFIPILLFFMSNLQRINYCFHDDPRIDYFLNVFFGDKCISHITKYEKYYEAVYKMGGWEYNDSIKELMLNFST